MTLALNIAGTLLFAAGVLAALNPALAGRLAVVIYSRLWPGLNTRIRIERYYYRHHRITGLATMTGGIVLIYLSVVITGNFHPLDQKSLEALIRDAGAVLFLVSGLLITVIGMVVFIRPSVLKPLESWANQPVTRQKVYAFLTESLGMFKNFVAVHPRWVGILLALTGLGLIFMAGK